MLGVSRRNEGYDSNVIREIRVGCWWFVDLWGESVGYHGERVRGEKRERGGRQRYRKERCRERERQKERARERIGENERDKST